MAQSTGEAEEANIYRVCAGGADRWHIFQHPASVPLASFTDKAAALNYAMCLARGRVAWHLLLRRNGPSGARANASSHH